MTQMERQSSPCGNNEKSLVLVGMESKLNPVSILVNHWTDSDLSADMLVPWCWWSQQHCYATR